MNICIIIVLLCIGIILFSIEIVALTTDSLWHEPKSDICRDCNYMKGIHKYWYRHWVGPSTLFFRCDICEALYQDHKLKESLKLFKSREKAYQAKLKQYKKLREDIWVKYY